MWHIEKKKCDFSELMSAGHALVNKYIYITAQLAARAVVFRTLFTLYFFRSVY